MLTSLTSSIDPRPLGLARIIIGIAAVIRSYVAWRVLSRLAEPEVLKIPYAEWLPEPSLGLAISVVGVWAVAAVLFTIGWRVALSGPILLGAIVITLSLDEQAYSNHLYLMAWLVLLLTLASAGSGINIARQDRLIVRWPVFLIMLQASLVYGFSAFTKFNESFLSGSVLASTLGRGVIPFPERLITPQVLSLVAAGVVFVELFVAIFLWRRRLRPIAFLLGLALHLSITLLMTDTLELLVFSLEMMAIYPLFLSRSKLIVIFDGECASCRRWVSRLKQIDVLHVLDPVLSGAPSSPLEATYPEPALQLVHHGASKGFRAMTLALEHLVPTLWVAPILRLPGVRNLGEWWYRSQARRARCPAGIPTNLERGSVSAV